MLGNGREENSVVEKTEMTGFLGRIRSEQKLNRRLTKSKL